MQETRWPPSGDDTAAPPARLSRQAAWLSWQAVCAIGAVVIAAYFLMPGDRSRNAVYSGLGIAVTLCLVLAARRQPPRLRVGWYRIAAANACFVLGDGISTIALLVTGSEATPPTVADVLYLAGYPFLFAGVLRISNVGALPTARETRADAALVSLGALTVASHFLTASYRTDSTLSVAGNVVTLAYPVMDVGILYLVVYGIFSGAARHTATKLLGAALCVTVAADLAYSELAVHSAYNPESLSNCGFLVAYVLFAAAAVVPPVPDPADTNPAEAGHWLPLTGAALLVPPVILLLSALLGAPVNVGVVAAMSLLLTGLAVLRASWLFDRLRRQTALLTLRGESLHQAIGAQHALQEDLERQATHDGLTGLANRALLGDRIAGALARDTAVAMCFCDLDGFKEVNDSLGHGVGDQLLIVVAKRLLATVRAEDVVARLGGDEFAILVDGTPDQDSAVALAERIVAVLQQPIAVGDLRIQLTASVGVAFARPETSAEVLLSEADAAMYEAKSAGKNRLAVFESQMRARVVHRDEVIGNFEGSLHRGQWLLEYQPQVRLADGALEGFEALVRWRHPTLGVLTPDQFITLAEETGFIVELGRWILQASCVEAARWGGSSTPLTVSVNVSGRHLQQSTLLEDVRAALAASGLPAEQLQLEITERALDRDPVAVIAVLGAIRDLGVRIAIDDFGTGYCSLSYLGRLPVDAVKIDKSFIDPLADPHSNGAALIEIVLRLARHFRLTAIAEGVEHHSQHEALQLLRCDSAQGFLLSRPLSGDGALRFIEQYAPAPIVPAR